MKENIQVRKFKIADLDSAIEVYKDLCEFYNRSFNFDESKKFFSIRSYFEQYYTIVAFDKSTQKVVALAFGEILTEETQETSGYVKLIYVSENYRKMGIMTALINNMIAYFKEIQVDQVRIHLNNQNLPFLNYYYEKLGFSPIITIVEKSLKQ